jgi:hypothetical protein
MGGRTLETGIGPPPTFMFEVSIYGIQTIKRF